MMGWGAEDQRDSKPISARIDVVKQKLEVIEGKLLAALDDKSKVAVVLSEDDLLLLIEAALWLNKYPVDGDEKKDRLENLIEGMEQLGQEAFGGE